MSKRAALSSLLLLLSLAASSKNHESLEQKNFLKRMNPDTSLINAKYEEVTLHKVWKYKSVNKLHPHFSDRIVTSNVIESIWSVVDFTDTKTGRFVSFDGQETFTNYSVVNGEIVLLPEGRRKRKKRNESRVSFRISRLTAQELGITLFLHAGKDDKEMGGEFVEWVFEEVQ